MVIDDRSQEGEENGATQGDRLLQICAGAWDDPTLSSEKESLYQIRIKSKTREEETPLRANT